jgi:predicted lipoprotein with Yx(FWY)xxD motif
MRTSTIVWIVIIILVIIGGVWWFTSSQSAMMQTGTPTTTTTTTDTSQTQPTLTLNLGSNATLGDYLVASNGMTLYRFNKDSIGTSTCYAECATEWPPYIVSSAADLSAISMATGTVEAIARTDGSLQVTYNGKPLYFFVDDKVPGDATGQNKDGFFVVAP